MKRHSRSFFGQKSGIIFDSGEYTQESIYLTFIKKGNNDVWEKPSEGQGVKIKLNLGEIIMIRRVLMCMDEKWSSVHKFNDDQTSISVNRTSPDSEEIWIAIDRGSDKYRKNIAPPETEILLLLLNHIIDEKIANATVPQAQSGASGEEGVSNGEKKPPMEKQRVGEQRSELQKEVKQEPAKQEHVKEENKQEEKRAKMKQYYSRTVSF